MTVEQRKILQAIAAAEPVRGDAATWAVTAGWAVQAEDGDIDLTEAEKYIPEITRHLLEEEVPYGICYNVNFPVGQIEGIQWTRQCRGHWEKELAPHTDEQGRTYYTLVGNYVNLEPDAEDTDEYALAHHRISITPTSLDLTAYQLL